MSGSPRGYDLTWTAGNLAAMVFLCAAFAVALAVRHAARTTHVGEEIPVNDRRARAATERINPNTADMASLQRLAGIGPAKARAIVAYRRLPGAAAFRSAGDLEAVRGIGPTIAGRIEPHLAFPAATHLAPAGSP